MDAGLSAAIVDPRQEFGIKPPEDQRFSISLALS
jgi:hypothetical protein